LDYLDEDELNFLLRSYSTLLEGVDITCGTVIFDRYASVEFCGERYGSLDSRSERSSYAIAPWVGVGGQIDPATTEARPAVVHYYLRQNICLHGELKSLVMARVSWLQKHPDRHRHDSGSAEIWCKDIFEPFPCKITPWNFMEFCGIRWKIFHGILSGIGTWNSMEFYGVPQKLNSVGFCLVLGHGIPWNP